MSDEKFRHDETPQKTLEDRKPASSRDQEPVEKHPDKAKGQT